MRLRNLREPGGAAAALLPLPSDKDCDVNPSLVYEDTGRVVPVRGRHLERPRWHRGEIAHWGSAVQECAPYAIAARQGLLAPWHSYPQAVLM